MIKEEGIPQSLNNDFNGEPRVTQQESAQLNQVETSLSNAPGPKSSKKPLRSPTKGLPIPVNTVPKEASPGVEKALFVEGPCDEPTPAKSKVENPTEKDQEKSCQSNSQDQQSTQKQKTEDQGDFSKMRIVTLFPGGLKVFRKQWKNLIEEKRVDLSEHHDLVKDVHEKYLVSYSNFEVSVYQNSRGDVNPHIQLGLVNPKHLWFSNTTKFLCVINKPARNYVLQAYDLDLKTKVFEKDLGGKIAQDQVPNLKFTDQDELVYFQESPTTVRVYRPFEDFKEEDTLKFKPFDYFMIKQKNDREVLVILVTKHNESNQVKRKGKIKIVNPKNLNKPILDRSYKRAHEFELKWSPDNENVLICAKDYIDDTGKSYYGANSLYFFNLKTRSYKDVTTYAGPIHEFSWDPEGVNFIAISGFMPAHSVLYSKKGRAFFKFGSNHRNKIYWSPNGELFALAGLENLKGDIDIWDYKKREIIGSCTSNHASYFEWAPNSSLFLTAIVERTLKVGNEFRIFDLKGKLSVKKDYSDSKLFDAKWVHDGKKTTADDLGIAEHGEEAEEEQVEQEEVKPKKKKLAFKWDDDGILTKTEKARVVSEKEIKEFNDQYKKDLQKQKAIEDKKRADYEAKKKAKKKAPVVLQRGRFKIGQKLPEKDTGKDADKKRGKNGKRKGSKKIQSPGSDKNSVGDIENGKKKNKKKTRKLSKLSTKAENFQPKPVEVAKPEVKEVVEEVKEEVVEKQEAKPEPVCTDKEEKEPTKDKEEAEPKESESREAKDSETTQTQEASSKNQVEEQELQQQMPDPHQEYREYRGPNQYTEEDYYQSKNKGERGHQGRTNKQKKKKQRRRHYEEPHMDQHYGNIPMHHQQGHHHQHHQQMHSNSQHQHQHQHHQHQHQYYQQDPRYYHQQQHQGQHMPQYDGYQQVNPNVHYDHNQYHHSGNHHNSMYQMMNDPRYNDYRQGHHANFEPNDFYGVGDNYRQDHHAMYDNRRRGDM